MEKADLFAHCVYKLSRKLPKEEIFGLISQIRRAALSVPLNITEGFARQNSKEYKRFLEIAYGSLKETKYLLFFIYHEGYISKDDYQKNIDLSEEIGKIIWVSIKTIKNKIDC